jgi:hypothetical protein
MRFQPARGGEYSGGADKQEVATSRRMAAATTKMAALNSATSSNAIDPNAEDNCDDAETGNAQESNGYEELPELQAVSSTAPCTTS